jgi:hypothetical protein
MFLLVSLALIGFAHSEEPITIRFGFANVGVDNRQFSGGNATAHAPPTGCSHRASMDCGKSRFWHGYR